MEGSIVSSARGAEGAAVRGYKRREEKLAEGKSDRWKGTCQRVQKEVRVASRGYRKRQLSEG